MFFSFNTTACEGECKKKKQSENGYSLEKVLLAFSKNTNSKLLVDREVKGSVMLYGQAINEITYDNLLAMLNLSGYTAYKKDGYIIVIPNKSARTSPLEIVSKDTTYPEYQYVTDVVKVEKACATRIIPVLRPLVPQQGHMAAYRETNSIILTDTYSNIQKIRGIVKALDSSLQKPLKCESKSK